MQRNTGYFPTESLEPSGNRLFSRSALNEGYLFRGSLENPEVFQNRCPAQDFYQFTEYASRRIRHPNSPNTPLWLYYRPF